jgi:hypothetical protein
VKPRILIASSVEGKDVAEALQVNLDRETRPTVWHQAFPLSRNTIDTLLENSAKNDFAVFVFSADDLLAMRKHEYQAPRDNVVIEYGFFVGMRGKDRAFIVVPRNKPDLHLPTDLLGLTVADYDAARPKSELRASLGPATTLIKEAIGRSTWVTLRPLITINSRSHRPAPGKKSISYPVKLYLNVTNNHRDPVAIESVSFELGSSLRFAPGSWTKPKFRIGKDDRGEDIYEYSCIVEPNKTMKAWVGIDPNIDDVTVDAAIRNTTAGVWQYRCSWLGKHVVMCDYEQAF